MLFFNQALGRVETSKFDFVLRGEVILPLKRFLHHGSSEEKKYYLYTMENNLSTNPAHTVIQDKIREMLYEDLSKSDIREKIKEAHPNFPDHLFERCFTEAFCTL